MEGYWVGTMTRSAVGGGTVGPKPYSENATVPDLPYPQGEVQMFVNLTIRETRLYKHVYYVYQAADAEFCADEVPTGFENAVRPGRCGQDGYVASTSKFGAATHEKDGVAEIFTATGFLNGKDVSKNMEKGSVTPVDSNTLYTVIRSKYYSETETVVFNNADRTRVSGSGQYSEAAPSTIPDFGSGEDVPMVLKETYSFDLKQTDLVGFSDSLSVAQEEASVPSQGRVAPITAGDCMAYVFEDVCPNEETYAAAGDPKVTATPYAEDASVKGGFIAMFVIIGVALLAIIGFFAHRHMMASQADRYKHQFARRIAQTIDFEGTMENITPEALEKEFAKLDEDGNGDISKEELRHFMGEKMNDRDFEALFAAIDIDHNGTIDYDEFIAFMGHVGSMPDIKNEKIIDGEGEHPKQKLNTAFDDNLAEAKEKEKKLIGLVGFLGLCAIGLLIATIVMASKANNAQAAQQTVVEVPYQAPQSNVPDNLFYDIETQFAGKTANYCENKNPKWENKDCVHLPGPQAGANVTKGFVGGMNVSYVPNTKNYWQSAMCPVNVHWHLGTEHYSVGEFDEFGDGPQGNADAPNPMRRLAGGEADGQEFNVRGGFRCHHYDENDPMYTTPYEWKHCLGMLVGETYEIHWPHSAAGACGTAIQYQTPFYDGVFCNLNDEIIATLGPQDVASAVGVHGQIFTIVNDESYFYPDLIRGMVVDAEMSMGQDIHYYTGSTTGTSRSNEICSTYTPITWQVDRKCHMISASSFDKLCYDMKLQIDDMADDLYAHGSRELVATKYVANNQARQRKLRSHDHDHAHDHDHDHDHEHQKWY
uniref:EF-hand domain-containing protein n=1 Tax=Pseudictyota dubia TaxID=2749911 RepID=A0A7R9ZFZ0_9STRA